MCPLSKRGKTRPMTKPRIQFLDTLRGIAAAWVVLFHLNEVGKFAPSAYLWFVKQGWLGVPIFFVLSGYSIHASLLRSPSVSKFLWRRFWRIYPPYLASLILVTGLVVLRKLTSGTNDLIVVPHGLLGWLEVLTLTTKPIGSTPPINWVYWTLTYEAAFYLWLTLALMLPRLRWPIVFAPLVVSLTWHNAPPFFFDQWCLFALGVAIAEWRNERGALPPLLAIICLADALLHRTGGEVIAAGSAFVLVSMALSTRFAWLNRIPLLHRAGDWSYSLYLTHVPIGVWLALRIDPYPRTMSAASLPAHIGIDAFAFAMCCGFAVLFWRLVEKPSIAIAHGKVASPTTAVPQPTQPAKSA